jgi:prepilin signal peptidase PulO-like enzyme (type II secretory pathway)
MFYIFLFATIGLVIGSFANCFVWRLHENESLMNRSYCPKCRKQIAWYDNVPVLSFLLLRGRCRHCKEEINWQYPIVEMTMSVLFAAIAYVMLGSFGGDLSYLMFLDNHSMVLLARNLLIIFAFIVVFIYDFRWFLVSDRFVLPAAGILLAMNIYLGADWRWAVLSCIIGGFFFLVQFVISRGKWVGGGDIRLGILVGAAFGRLDYLLLILMVSYFIGSLVAVPLLLMKKKGWKSELPFGVFLAISSIVCLFFGQATIDWYMSFL